MSIQFIITIDTEEDQWSNYCIENNTVENVNSLPFLQQVFDKHNAIPTYLINWPIVTNIKSVEIIKKLNSDHACEIGTHCHPWNTPPYQQNTSQVTSMMCDLDYDTVKQKMIRLHEKIVNTLGVTPVSFRAGRWGFGTDVARCIQELGYKIDSSITPFVNWSIYGGPNFDSTLTAPYFFSLEENFKKRSTGSLLEIPPTIGFLQKNFIVCNWWRRLILTSKLHKFHLLGILDRTRVLNFRWLSPELSSSQDMIKLIEIFVEKGHQVLNMSFHSTSLFPGKSPFVKSQEDLNNFIKRIDNVLDYCVKQNFEFTTLSGASMKNDITTPRLL